ncbi:peptidylprolyl isomerase, partial [Acinetobacter baumannii]|nr:peptidylprolyl isomerase [Acinetobacter baumannii]
MGFRPLSDIPAELAARITPLQDGQTTDLISVRDGVHVLKLLERKQNEQKALVPQYQTRHILIQPSEVVSPENAKQIIDSIYKRLKAGEDFAILAATYSNDTGSARDGGSLGWVTPGMMVPEFDKKMQEIPVGEISEPFQTQFGWHILQVTDKREKDMTHEYQERMARQILGERQFNTEIDSWLREVRANAYVEIKDPSLDKKNLQK